MCPKNLQHAGWHRIFLPSFVLRWCTTILAFTPFLLSVKTCDPPPPPPLPSNDCNCPYRFNIGQDSKRIELLTNTSKWSINGQILAKFGKWELGPFKGGYTNPNETKKEVIVVARTITDVDPKRTYDLLVCERWFCAKYETYCQTKMLESKKVELILKELDDCIFPPIRSSVPPKSSSPSPKKYSVSFVTQPADAKIYIDGTFRGLSNRTILLSVGSHKVDIRADGYQSIEDIYEVTSIQNQPQVYPAVLKPIPLTNK